MNPPKASSYYEMKEKTTITTTPASITTSSASTTSTTDFNNSNNFNSNTTATINHNNNYNIFRDTYIRYVGYTNEIGESFRYQYPRFVIPSYVIAFTYCLSDALYTGYRTYNNYSLHRDNVSTVGGQINNNHYQQSSSLSCSNTNTTADHDKLNLVYQKCLYVTFDSLLWQSLASVIIPGYTIQTIVKCTNYIISSSSISSSILIQPFLSSNLFSSILLSQKRKQRQQKMYHSINHNQQQNHLFKKQQRRLLYIWIKRWIPTITGILFIPIIIHPIDHIVDSILNETTRKIF